MDSRFRFLHYLKNEAVTQKDSLSRVMVNSVHEARLLCSEVRTTGRLSEVGKRNKVVEVSEFTLARKAASANLKGTRTANRRRWAR